MGNGDKYDIYQLSFLSCRCSYCYYYTPATRASAVMHDGDVPAWAAGAANQDPRCQRNARFFANGVQPQLPSQVPAAGDAGTTY